MRVFEAALNATWAMEERALETLLDIVARENVNITPEALEAYKAKTLAGADRVGFRDGVAVLDAIGPLVKRANMFTAISGATSYDLLRTDLQAALDDPKVKAIILNIDSPGGEASGTGELAQAVFDARGQKPIIAYIGGTGASAAYWLASAADSIVIDPTAVLGSIGVQVAGRVPSPKAGEKAFRFVSSQSPNKNPEFGTDESDRQIQSTIDAMAQVFVETVARNRNVATETVLTDFGKGGTFVGLAAVTAGLADGLGTFESVLAELSASRGGRKAVRKGTNMSDEATFTAVERDAAVTAGVTAAKIAERARVAGLTKLALSAGVTGPELTAAIDGDTDIGSFALSLADGAAARTTAALVVANAAEAKRLAGLQTDEAAAAAVAAAAAIEPDANSLDAVVARINAA